MSLRALSNVVAAALLLAGPTRGAMPSPTPGTNAPPAILAVRLSSTTVHVGQLVTGTVVTSLNTASLQASIGTYGMSIPKTGPGIFSFQYRVPLLALVWHGKFSLVFTARNTRGDPVTASVPITVR